MAGETVVQRTSKKAAGLVASGLMALVAVAAVVEAGGAREPALGVSADRWGDPLPAGAVARLGSIRLRHGDAVGFACFSADGSKLATSGRYGDHLVLLSETATGRPVLSVTPAKAAEVLALALSPDAARLAIINTHEGGRLTVWDARTGEVILERSYAGKEFGSARLLAFSRDGKHLAVAYRTLQIIDLASGRTVELPFKGHVGEVRSFVFSHDDRFLFTLDRNENLSVLDGATGAVRGQWPKQAGLGQPLARTPLAVSPDGHYLALGRDRAVRLWKATFLDNPKAPVRLEEPREWDTFSTDVAEVAFSADGKSLVAVDYTGLAQVRDMASGETLLRRESKDRPLAAGFAAGRPLVASTRGMQAWIWDVKTGAGLHDHAGHRGSVWGLVFSRDGKTLASYGAELLLWDTSRWALGRWLDIRCQDARFAPDGKELTTLTDKVTSWEVPSLNKVRERDAPKGSCFLAPDRKTLIRAVYDEVMNPFMRELTYQVVATEVWDAEASKRLRRFDGLVPGEGYSGRRSHLSPDGLLFATGGSHGVWCLDDGRAVIEWRPAESYEKPVFSADGRLLALLHDEHIVLWEVVSAQRIASWKVADKGKVGHDPAVVLSSDGRWLALGTDKGEIEVREAQSGKPLARLTGHRYPVRALAFSPDNRHLVSAGATEVLVWDVRHLRAQDKDLPLDEKHAARLWQDLASADIAHGRAAVARLAAAGEGPVRLIKDKVFAAQPVAAQHLERLLTDLADKRFSAREAASKALLELDEATLPALRKLAKDPPSLEAGRRAERAIKTITSPQTGGAQLRLMRAVEVLERIGSGQAQTLVEYIAGGAAEARLTRAARAALERMRH